jgi:hypothetical protein
MHRGSSDGAIEADIGHFEVIMSLAFERFYFMINTKEVT